MKKEVQNYLEKVTGKTVYVDAIYKKCMSPEDSQHHIAILEIDFKYLEDDEEKTFSKVVFNIIDTPTNRRTNCEYDVLETMDNEASELGEIASDLSRAGYLGTMIQKYSYLFCMDDIVVSDEFRNKGIGSKIMKNIAALINEACNLQCFWILFIPVALYKEDRDELESFFIKNGGKPLLKNSKTWYIEM